MLNFYELENNIENSTIVVYVNTNPLAHTKKNTFCLEMYAKYGIDEKATNIKN